MFLFLTTSGTSLLVLNDAQYRKVHVFFFFFCKLMLFMASRYKNIKKRKHKLNEACTNAPQMSQFPVFEDSVPVR